jgi:hypothetical protein
MANGWIKLHRQFLEWEWYNDSDTFRLFIHLLLKANHKPKSWRGVFVSAGQVITGRKILAEELTISEQRVRTLLNKLKSTNEITIKSTNKYSLITICNWTTYQGQQDENNQQNNQQLTAKKDDKKGKKKKKVEKIQLPYGEKFEKTWNDWKQYRTDKKKKLVLTTIRLQLNKLAKYKSEKTAIAILEQSMINGWVGIFDLKDKSTIPDHTPYDTKGLN